MPKQNNHICIVSNVLLSMKKDRVYNVVIVICGSTTKVSTAYLAYPAGLAGCCNHITATFYCLDNYITSTYMKIKKQVVPTDCKHGIVLGERMLMPVELMKSG